MIFLIFLILILTTACATTKTVVETKIEYISPEIPETLLEPCERIPSIQAQTNGELLMAYITLQTMYTICSSKITSISLILENYKGAFEASKEEVPIEQ